MPTPDLVRRAWLLAFVSVLMLADSASAAIISQKVQTIGNYKLQFTEGSSPAFRTRLDVFRQGRLVFTDTYEHVWIFSMDKQADSFEMKPNEKFRICDLTGDGVKDVVLQTWNGGAYCCYTYSIYSLGTRFKRIWYHDAGCGHLHVRLRTNRPAVLEIEDAGFVFMFPFTVSDGPRPIVRYTWNGKHFVLDRSLMRKPVNKELFDRACRADASLESFMRCLIELVYSGRSDFALRLVKESPQATRDNMNSFFETFRKSRNYYRIVELNDRNYFAELERFVKSPQHIHLQ